MRASSAAIINTELVQSSEQSHESRNGAVAQTVQSIVELFRPLNPTAESEVEALQSAPQLAHYTSLETLEKILTTDEIWFSNPLFMNDLEEVRFGILEGVPILKGSKPLQEVLGVDRTLKFIENIEHYQALFDLDHLFDTYVFCLSQHDPDDSDGRLPMWRGYGGNGRGVAMVFDTSKIPALTESPLVISRVVYGSSDERRAWVTTLASDIAKIVATNEIPEELSYVVAYAAFERLKLFALFTKHRGFMEEKEWRLVYMPDRDATGLLKPMRHYANGARGVEPKLRLKIAPLPGAIPEGISLNTIVAKILIGPTPELDPCETVDRKILEIVQKPGLKDKLVVSSIPLRRA